MSAKLENTLFQLKVLPQILPLKFTAKTLNRQSRKAQKDESNEKAKLKKALMQGNNDGARIYASNAIRKKNEALNLLRLASRIDAVATRVQTAMTMKQLSGNMLGVVKGMDQAMKTMNLERISGIMDTFETQFSDLDVQTGYMEDTMSSTIATSTPQDEIDLLLQQTADEANIELKQGLTAGEIPGKVPDIAEREEGSKVGEEDKELAERLRALRPTAS
ncbi:Snf7-domain-containing protein [Clavulina sp. PMI_390]|nr:Snf7-domain-containing protein [Clavulina sp. PMI_390]